MNQKTVIYLHQYFCIPTMPGGTRSWEFSRRLVRDGWRVIMVTSDINLPNDADEWIRLEFGEYADNFVLRVHKVPYSNNMNFPRRILSFIHFAFLSSYSVVREPKADFVFATSTPLSIVLPAWLRKILRGTPYIFEVRDLWPEMPIAVGAIKSPWLQFISLKIEYLAYKYAHKVVALSPGMRDSVISSGKSPEDVVEIPNSCDLELFNVDIGCEDSFFMKYPHLRGKYLIVYAGAFGLVNGVEYLAKLAAEVIKSNTDVKFAIFGKGAKKEYIIAKATELEVLNKNFFVEDPVPKIFMPILFSVATVSAILFAPIKEMEKNSSNKFFDSLAAGKPVIINYEGWQKELVQGSGCGIVLDAYDLKQSSIRLIEFLKDENKINRAKNAALHLAQDMFSRDILYQKLASTFDQLIKSLR